MIIKALFLDYDLKRAVSDPRLHNQLSPSATFFESDFDKVRLVDGKKIKLGWGGGGKSASTEQFLSQILLAVIHSLLGMGKIWPSSHKLPPP